MGIGLITALAGATEIQLVIHGKYTILDMGTITPEIIIAMFGVVIVAIPFCIGLLVGTLIWWITEESFPSSVASDPHAEEDPVMMSTN